MSDALALGEDRDLGCDVAFDLRLVEDAVAPREEARLLLLGVGRVGFLGRLDAARLPEHDGRGTLASTHLGADRLPVPIGPPQAGRIAGGLGGHPERDNIDAAVGLARADVDGAGGRGAVVMPRHAPLAGAGLDGGNDLGGDLLIEVGTGTWGAAVHGGLRSGPDHRSAP